MCNRDCFKCPYEDCIEDTITQEERSKSNSLDRTAKKFEPLEAEVRKANLDWYNKVKDSEEFKQGRREYRQKNKDSISQRGKDYYKEHREEIRQRHSANWYANLEENRKRARERKRKRYHENLEESRRKQRGYRARRKEQENELKVANCS